MTGWALVFVDKQSDAIEFCYLISIQCQSAQWFTERIEFIWENFVFIMCFLFLLFFFFFFA